LALKSARSYRRGGHPEDVEGGPAGRYCRGKAALGGVQGGGGQGATVGKNKGGGRRVGACRLLLVLSGGPAQVQFLFFFHVVFPGFPSFYLFVLLFFSSFSFSFSPLPILLFYFIHSYYSFIIFCSFYFIWFHKII
jgi:hypothetical protein